MIRTLFAALALVVVLFLQVTPALASCTQHTYFLNGRMIMCQTCCYFGNNCTTTCF